MVEYTKLVGCKHRASEGVFYIGGRECQFIELVMFARCAFIFALRNIALGGYLDTRRNTYGTTYSLKQIYIYIKSVPLNSPESSLRLQLFPITVSGKLKYRSGCKLSNKSSFSVIGQHYGEIA